MYLCGVLGTETLLITEILKRLPVKSLVRFRSVSKAWSHLINDPSFVTRHLQFNKASSSILGISYPQFENIRIDHTLKTTLERLKTPLLWRLKPDPSPHPRYHGSRLTIRGHGNGLVLVFDSETFLVDDFTPEFPSKTPWLKPKTVAFQVDKYIICNPIARRFQILPESTIEPPDLDFVDEPHLEHRKVSAVGLGFVDDVVYKVVRVTYGVAQVRSYDSMTGYRAYEPPWVEAYDSRSCSWRRVSMNPEFSYEYLNDGVFNSSDGCLYWLGNRGYKYSVLVWFHLVNETWRETLLPYKMDCHDDSEGPFDGHGFCEFVQVLGGSVVLFVGDRRNKLLCNVWKMHNEEDHNKVSWTHMCRLNFVGCPLGFIRDDELLLMMNSRRKKDPRRVFMTDGEFFGTEACPREDRGKFVQYDLKKKNNACYGLTDLDFRVTDVVPDFVESLLLLDGDGVFIEEVSETYYLSVEDIVEETHIEEEDFGDFSSMFDDNFEFIF